MLRGGVRNFPNAAAFLIEKKLRPPRFVSLRKFSASGIKTIAFGYNLFAERHTAASERSQY